jgi:hypothetical protein
MNELAQRKFLLWIALAMTVLTGAIAVMTQVLPWIVAAVVAAVASVIQFVWIRRMGTDN